jgi:predicted nucleic acid-binding Zn ribbon protein
MLQQPARHIHTQTDPSHSQQQQQAPQVEATPAAVVQQLELRRQQYNQQLTQQASAAAAAAPGTMTWALDQQISAAAIQGKPDMPQHGW